MITVREMQIDDLEQILPIEEANFSDPWTMNGFFSFLLREDALFLTAEENGRILGYCGAILISPECDITNVCVESSARRRGIGKKLIETLKDHLRQKGIHTMHLEVRAGNQGAIALYQNLGFVQDGLRPGYYDHPTEDAILMSAQF